MFKNISLRTKFSIALLSAALVIVTSGMSIRLLSKAALFHHLERDHLAVVARANTALMLVTEGGRSSRDVPKADLVDSVRKGRQLAEQAVSELLPIEKLVFNAIGFGAILRQPQAVIGLATEIEKAAAAYPGSRLTPELAAEVAPDLAKMRAASDRFGPLVAEATQFIRVTSLFLTFVPMGFLLAFLLLLRESTLRPMGKAMEAAQRMAAGDYFGETDFIHSNDEFGQILKAIDQTRTKLADLRSARTEDSPHTAEPTS